MTRRQRSAHQDRLAAERRVESARALIVSAALAGQGCRLSWREIAALVGAGRLDRRLARDLRSRELEAAECLDWAQSWGDA